MNRHLDVPLPLLLRIKLSSLSSPQPSPYTENTILTHQNVGRSKYMSIKHGG